MATGSRSAHPTRQARRRAATYDAIVHAARTLLAHHQELTLRGVAAQMGSSPAGLYRYVANLDELRDLVAAAIDESLAADIRADVERLPVFDSTSRWLAAWTALRRWALTRPDEFNMLVLRPRSAGVPVREVSDALLGQLLHDIWQQHAVPLLPTPPAAEGVLANAVRIHAAGDGSTDLAWLQARACASLHGVITLEVTGYIEPALVDSASLYRATMIDWLARLGQIDELDRLLPVLDAELAR